MPPSSRILIVDASPDNRQVLRTALEKRGIEILEAARTRQGLALAQTARPDLVIWNLEDSPPNTAAVTDEVLRQTPASTELVFLGGVGRPVAHARSAFVPQPYHYPRLISTIEHMLSARRAA
ncbi:MAG: response regulator [Pirellulales bacterium]|nr:response regulator [Pirellulales bacterium]